MSLVVVLLLFVVMGCAAGSSNGGCPPEFEDMCECGLAPRGPQKQLAYVTSCVNAGFDHALMLRHLPPQTEILEFVGNDIRDLPPNIFGQETVYEKLRSIDLSNNHIQTIKGKTFHNVANVTRLVLDDNDLWVVAKDHHPRMFSNFVRLRELSLRNAFTEKAGGGDYLGNLAEIFGNSSLLHLRALDLAENEITELRAEQFCSLPSLERLGLGGNHLRDLPPLNFSCLGHLTSLDLSDNRIPFLGERSIASLEQTTHLSLNLTSNPFRCDCRMIGTFEWLHTTLLTLVDREHLQCHDGSHVGKAVTELELGELRCLPPVLGQHHTASTVVLSVGFACLALVLGVLGYRNRAALGVHASRLLQPIRSKFHYVSLERRDGGRDSMEV